MKRYILIVLSVIVLVAGFLRMYGISSNPPGLYIDEVSIGLNAYDILTTGKDQYGVNHPLLFRSLGDYKVPGYIYIVSASMALFGKNEFAIRFPSSVAGTATILVIFFLVRELLGLHEKTKKDRDIVSLITAGTLAVAPWHLHFSRGGFEAVVALFFYTLALYLAVLFWQKKKTWYVIAICLLFLAAMYTYDAYRALIPLTAISGFILGIQDKAKRKGVLFASVILVIGALPLFLFSLSGNGQARFVQTSAFAENPYNTGIVKIFGDVAIFIRNYLSYFSITYLFRFGDQINRHQVNDLGILYVWQLPFIVAGIYFFNKTKNRALTIVLAIFLFLGAIPASIARPSPHTLRFLMGVVPYAILTALGIFQLVVQKNKWLRFGLVVIGIFAVVEIGYYFFYYAENYPKEALIDWGGACKQTALTIQEKSKSYQYIVIDKNVGCLSEYFLFYIPNISLTKVDPSWVKPKVWGSQKVLYVRPYYGNPYPSHLVENVYLPNINHDIFTQLIQL